MTEAQKELISIWAAQYFGSCITYSECEQWAKGLLQVIENQDRIKECLEIKNEN